MTNETAAAFASAVSCQYVAACSLDACGDSIIYALTRPALRSFVLRAYL
eukprot:SAG11_NODE_37546_length_256_cov_0.987261_1_plen_48_part_01